MIEAPSRRLPEALVRVMAFRDDGTLLSATNLTDSEGRFTVAVSGRRNRAFLVASKPGYAEVLLSPAFVSENTVALERVWSARFEFDGLATPELVERWQMLDYKGKHTMPALAFAFEKQSQVRHQVQERWPTAEGGRSLALLLAAFATAEDIGFLLTASPKADLTGGHSKENYVVAAMVEPSSDAEWGLMRRALAGEFGLEARESATVNLRLNGSAKALALLEEQRGGSRRASAVSCPALTPPAELGTGTVRHGDFAGAVALVGRVALSGEQTKCSRRFQAVTLSKEEDRALVMYFCWQDTDQSPG